MIILRNILLLCLLLAFAFSCNNKPTSSYISIVPLQKNVALLADLADMTNPCNDPSNYIPDPDYLQHTSFKRIKVNFHVMRTSDGKGNFNEKDGRKFINETLISTNQSLYNNHKMKLPLGNNTPVLSSRYGFELTGTSYIPGDDGIYFHDDDEFYFVISRGFGKNIYDRGVFEKYGIQKDSVLNVFIQDVHVDSLKSKKYNPVSNGIAFSTWVKGGLWYYAMKDTVYNKAGKATFPKRYRPAKQLSHEIGHVFGLRHAWGNDSCDDTPKHSNCWNSTGKPPCEIASNNVMDYNANMAALTPCQLGRVHKYALTNKMKRALLVKDWCALNLSKTIVIRDSVVWNSCKTVQGNLVIENGGKLIIRCKTSLPNNAQITVHPMGELILQGATLYNDCKSTWKGIKVMKTGKQEGKVTHIGKASKIENCQKEIAFEQEVDLDKS